MKKLLSFASNYFSQLKQQKYGAHTVFTILMAWFFFHLSKNEFLMPKGTVLVGVIFASAGLLVSPLNFYFTKWIKAAVVFGLFILGSGLAIKFTVDPTTLAVKSIEERKQRISNLSPSEKKSIQDRAKRIVAEDKVRQAKQAKINAQKAKALAEQKKRQAQEAASKPKAPQTSTNQDGAPAIVQTPDENMIRRINERDSKQRFDAYYYSVEEIKTKLKAPSTAKFASMRESVIQKNNKTKYTVISHVDSQNGFGAMVRTRFFCYIEFPGENEYIPDCALLE